jgi:hypothetical protein
MIFIVLILLLILIVNGYKENFANSVNPSIFTTPKNISTKLSDINLEFKTNRLYQEPEKYNTDFDKIKVNNPPNKTYEDELFKSVISYENEPFSGGKIGLEKCIENCTGECVEFGVTGNAHCFPNDGKIMKSSFYESLRDKSYETDMVDEKPNKLIYANLR